MHIRSSLLSLSAALLAVAGCHDGGGSEAKDMSQPVDLAPLPPDFSLPDRDPKDHPAALQLENHGGATLAAMEPYTIVWQGQDALGDKVHTFLGAMVTSSYWTAVLGEYGAKVGTPKALIVLPTAAPETLNDGTLDGIIKGLVDAGTIPELNDNTALFFVPPATTKSVMQGGTGCQDYGGYHFQTSTRFNGRSLPYSVNLQCYGDALNNEQAFAGLTETISHEAAEMQTDALPLSNPGWITLDSPLGAEVADLCVYGGTTFTSSASPPVTYYVTSVYSQAAAIAGDREPCQPRPKNEPFFNVAVAPREVHVTTDASGVGQATAQYQPFAYGSVGVIRWTLMQQPALGIKVTPTSGQGKAGQTFALTVKVTALARGGSYPLLLKVRSDVGQTFYAATVVVE